ncbi:kinetochore component CENP-S-domain-containing protein [Ampelomyces quisqualis]|uniref:Kinetochore component CENP-S-domain-containing protein n=1 Tax=Ampelomyces quisqualis TaxID=50730 RepID=A0A6A5QQL8_AMPQU|nr:kinetochore component CENP-S-domain-containing protein [Ampelomyces quisqualis]
MSSTEAANREERLKSALWYTIGQYIDEESLSSDTNTTPQFIGALTELVYTQIANTSHDLETFSAHAGRKVITTDDVMLLARRNDALETMLRVELERLRAAEGGAGGKGAQGKKRGRPAGKGKGGA